MSYQQLVWVA
ncbi:hypothetical protein C354_06259 [Cryptococcus neoformans MW-RSA1955]|nr:hypothetical protein C354_06259 [Cryptococcus neoformans var. grubii MW-RSA1955]